MAIWLAAGAYDPVQLIYAAKYASAINPMHI